MRGWTGLAGAAAIACLGVTALPAQSWSGYPQAAYPPDEQSYSEQMGEVPPPSSSAHGYEPQSYGNPIYDPRYGSQGADNRIYQGDEGDRADGQGGYEAFEDRRGAHAGDGYGYGTNAYGSREDQDNAHYGYAARGEDSAADRCAAAIERDSRRVDGSARVDDVDDVTPDRQGWRVQGVLLGDGGSTRRSFACVVGGGGRIAALTYGSKVRAR